jgi:hypothetical protein
VVVAFGLAFDACVADRPGRLLLATADLAVADVSTGIADALCARGLAVRTRDRVRNGSRMFGIYALAQAPRARDLVHLFGQASDFELNIKAVLELRLGQLQGTDPQLRGYVERAIRDLSPDPQHAVVWMRSIAERALQQVWKRELDDGELIPEEWINQWKFAKRGLAQSVVKEAVATNRKLPDETGRQCRLLQLATGCAEGATEVTRHASKQTYILISNMHAAGNYGQHRRNSNGIDIGFAASLCLSAIELARRLAAELK